MASLVRYSLFTSLLFLRLAVGAPTSSGKEARDDKFFIASIGDSWAAGVGLIAKTQWDGNKNWCFRHKAAYEALLADDDAWTDAAIDFKWPACSGATTINAYQPERLVLHTEPPQLEGIGRPHLLTVELGGNDAKFGIIARPCIYLGGQPEYPDPESKCTQIISDQKAYINAPSNGLYDAHHTMLQKILDWDTIRGRDDFYMYVIGYGEFFSTKPGSEWCNDASFGALPTTKSKLTGELRGKLNELVRDVNSILAKSVRDLNNDRVRFFNPSALFEGHRFCEPGHTLANQYFLNDVWFWNLSPPEDDPDYVVLPGGGTIINPVILIHENQWVNNQIMPSGQPATMDDINNMLGSGGSGGSSSPGRAFHPKDGGHQAMKDGLITAFRNDKVPGVKAAPPSTPPPTKQPYSSGQARMHINEFWSCLDDSNNLSVEVTIWDGANQQIGYMKRTQAGATSPVHMGSKFEDELVITPEWAKGGYIQFQLGSAEWNTNDDRDDNKPYHCHWGGYDPREGPQCYLPCPDLGCQPIYNPDAYALNQIDCWLPTPEWRHGKPSDGSSLPT